MESRSVQIVGFGIFPQLYVSLPRPRLLEIPPEIGYVATSGLTGNFLVRNSTIGTQTHFCVKPYRSHESNLDNLENFEELNQLGYEWEFVKNMVNKNNFLFNFFVGVVSFLLVNKVKIAMSSEIKISV